MTTHSALFQWQALQCYLLTHRLNPADLSTKWNLVLSDWTKRSSMYQFAHPVFVFSVLVVRACESLKRLVKRLNSRRNKELFQQTRPLSIATRSVPYATARKRNTTKHACETHVHIPTAHVLHFTDIPCNWWLFRKDRKRFGPLRQIWIVCVLDICFVRIDLQVHLLFRLDNVICTMQSGSNAHNWATTQKIQAKEIFLAAFGKFSLSLRSKFQGVRSDPLKSANVASANRPCSMSSSQMSNIVRICSRSMAEWRMDVKRRNEGRVCARTAPNLSLSAISVGKKLISSRLWPQVEATTRHSRSAASQSLMVSLRIWRVDCNTYFNEMW